jgi:hypothetical protein
VRVFGTAIALAAISIAPVSVRAQAILHVRIADTTGYAIPYATVDASPGGRRVADSVGVVRFEVSARADSVLLVVRRIGFMPGSFYVRPGTGVVEVMLTPAARALNEVVVSARRNNLLQGRGFYERIDQVRKGAYTGEFIMPEDLERISPGTLSRAFVESRYVRVDRAGARRLAVLTGRGGCGYTILIDGVRVQGTMEENITGATSINPSGTARRQQGETGIEELISGLEVVAIEVYPSAATAPSEIQARAMGGRGACGIIAIWTGRG